MRLLAGWGVLLAAGLSCAGSLLSQTLSNQSLTGKYFFRHVSIATDGAGNVTDARSLLGTITFDGAGNYTFTGQQVMGSAAAVALTGAGKSLVDPAGFVTLANPQRTNETVNARLGPEALLGSSTESANNIFDLFAAVPAPTGAAAFSGPYWAVTLEFPGGNTANARSAIFGLNSAGAGQFAAINAYGHGAAISGGGPTAQPVSGATFTVASDGTGTFSFGPSSNTLLSGSRSVYLSATGNMLLGGSTAPGSHDIIIGVKAMANPTTAAWNGNFWSAGLRFGAGENPAWVSYTASAAARVAGSSTWYRRLKELGAGSSDFTFVNSDSVNAQAPMAGLVTMGFDQIGLGTGGTFVGAAIDPGDPGAYEVFVGAPMANLSGSGVFLNPLGVTSAASFAPAGNPIAPGEFIALYGTGLAKSAQTAAPPYPSSGLNGVTVLVNEKAAPVYYVSSGQINCLIPYSTTGPTATIQVQNNGANSNTVTVPVAATAPGIYSLDSTGTGAGAILHSRDYSVVNAGNPAAPGETVLVYLTGLGAVNPAVDDGKAGGSNPLNVAVMPTVYVADQQALVGFSGLAPGFPGLYQLNVTIPSALPNAGNLPVAIQTGNAFHDQVFIRVQ